MINKVKALSEHFNLKMKEIILPTPDQYDNEFEIFKEIIEVVDVKQVVEYKSFDYTRLSTSNYFFRWL